MITFYRHICKFIAIIAILASATAAKAQYCTTGLYYYGCYYGDYIQSFSTTGGTTNISNMNSGCASGYAGYTYYNQTLTTPRGVPINFSIDNNPDYDAYYQMWIDYNNNGNYNDPGENVWTGQVITYGGNATGSFTVPGNVAPGTKRLRLRSAYGQTSTITPCGFFDYGEVEEYNVQIIGGPCEPITNLQASNLTLTSATISWTASNSNPINYEYRIDNSPNDPPSSGYSFTTATSLSLSPLSPSTCYYIHIRAICDPALSTTSESPWTTIQFCTVTDCVAPPVKVENVTSTTAHASWEPVPTVYAYEYAVSRGTDPPVNANHTTYTSVVLRGLEPNKAFNLHVRCRCAPTPLSPWTTVPFHTTTGVGVEEVDKDDFSVETYPNPVKEMLNVKLFGDMKGKATLTLTDITGKELYRSEVSGSSAEIGMQALPKGIYLLRYADGQRYITEKVIKE